MTRRAARALASAVRDDGLVLALSGALGTGKTEFVKGLADGLGVDPAGVASPTFVIASEYPEAAGGLAHVDLYRVATAGELEAAGFLDVLDRARVVAIEWAERLPDALPADRLELRLEHAVGDVRTLAARALGAGAAAVLARWRALLEEEGTARIREDAA